MGGFATQFGGGALSPQTLATIQLMSAMILPTQGNVYCVRPRTGSDVGGSGAPNAPFQTLARALGAATANQNDIVFMFAEGNTASQTTDYQTATLNWNKDGVHLIGVNDAPQIGQRSRVAFQSAFAGAGNLFTLAANNCLVSNLELFMGVASVNPIGCMKVTGQRNHIVNCQISGFGNSANDIAGAYSLDLAAAAENVFEGCYIGLDTVTLGAQANSQILCAAAATRNILRKCTIATYTNHASNNLFMRIPTGSLDRWLLIDDCLFINPVDAGSTLLTHGNAIASDAGGTVILRGSGVGMIGASGWNTTNSGTVTAISGTPTAASYGVGVDVTG